MKDIRLTRISLKNYKLFHDTTLEFSNGLNVFDGPNGYGKTSIFDAIEFIITGTIRRVTENSAINGTLKYDELFLANDSSEDVIIKAEFNIVDSYCTNKKVVIAKQIVSSHKLLGTTNYNPKKLTDITNTYFLKEFDQELAPQQLIDKKNLEGFQKEMFGDASQNLFFMLYYVKQEDRLDFFKNSEKERLKSIDSLFQIRKELEYLKDINNAKKSLKNLIDQLDNKIKRLSENLSKNMDSTVGHVSEYFKLINKSAPWDLEDIEIFNQEMLDNMLYQLKAIKSFAYNIKIYKEELKNIECQKFLNLSVVEKRSNLRSFCLYNQIVDDMEKYQIRLQNMKIIEEQRQLAVEGKYGDINFFKLIEILQIDISSYDCKQIDHLIKDYRDTKRMSESVQQTLTDILRIREQLLVKCTNSEIIESKADCPLCGCDWKDAEVFTNNVKITTERLLNLVGGSEKKALNILDELKMYYDKHISNKLQFMFQSYRNDPLLTEFDKIHSKDSLQKYENMKSIFSKIGIDTFHYKFTSIDAEEMYQAIEESIDNSMVLLPADYIEGNVQYKYSQVYDLYFDSIQEVEEIKKENIDKKISYLHNKFIFSQNELMSKITELSGIKFRLVDEIQTVIDDYAKLWKKCIFKYQAQIISKIEIPFYIYSARILQTYQGGQGIFIRQTQTSSKGEVDSIRFTTQEQQHDVLYTMSSGQLSGVLLSFSLALNKIFAKDGLSTIFIDDPVQCMDDLNIISFVELLRSEFNNSQILISTHEKPFAKYIIYKYNKHGLKKMSINLKEMVN